MAKAIKVTLGGREVRQVLRSTVRHDMWLMDKIQRSGIKEIHMLASESAEEYAQRLLETLIRSGSVTPLVAGCFIDEKMDDLQWSPEFAKELETYIDGLYEPEDKKKVFELVVNLVGSFFETGVVSLKTSLNSLKNDPKQLQTSAEKSTSGDGVAEMPTLESLTEQSGSSPETTTTRSS